MLHSLNALRRCGPAAALLVCGCPSEPRSEECPDGSTPEMVKTEACSDVFDCPPDVTLAFATSNEDFTPMVDGGPQELWFGGEQGGYHFFAGVEMHGLCDVVYLDFGIDLLPPGGGRENLVRYNRHPLTIRCETRPEWYPEGCDGDSTQQRWWPMQVIVPCDNHPVDPLHDADCAEPPVEPITDMEAILTVTATDHTGDSDPSLTRTASHEVQVEPVCCGGE